MRIEVTGPTPEGSGTDARAEIEPPAEEEKVADAGRRALAEPEGTRAWTCTAYQVEYALDM